MSRWVEEGGAGSWYKHTTSKEWTRYDPKRDKAMKHKIKGVKLAFGTGTPKKYAHMSDYDYPKLSSALRKKHKKKGKKRR